MASAAREAEARENQLREALIEEHQLRRPPPSKTALEWKYPFFYLSPLRPNSIFCLKEGCRKWIAGASSSNARQHLNRKHHEEYEALRNRHAPQPPPPSSSLPPPSSSSVSSLSSSASSTTAPTGNGSNGIQTKINQRLRGEPLYKLHKSFLGE